MTCPKVGSISATNKPRLILGSASPRRRDLLAQIGIEADEIRPADIDENPLKGERPRPYVERIARQKAEAINIVESEVVLSADTTVAAGHRILGKPADMKEAEAFLRLLSGRRHRVITSVVLRNPNKLWIKTVTSIVKLKNLSDQDIAAYLDSGEWEGKAGGYAIQGRAGAFVPFISGSYSNIVGLPLTETTGLLRAAGVIT